jgi:DNA-directed RNA polymerase subunit RPC12/RpoP
MFKSYSGYALPIGTRVAYTLQYRCSRCGSENVAIDEACPVPEFYDGSPSTADEFRDWSCAACSFRAEGRKFVTSRVDEQVGS